MRFVSDAGTWSWNAFAWGGVALWMVMLFAGCSNKEPLASVSGTVTLDGEPVKQGTVLFVSDTGDGGSAELQQDGTYTLQCRPGQFKVAVTPPAPGDPMAPGAAKKPAEVDIPFKYQDVGTSGLTTELKEGANTFDISLTSQK